MDVDMEATGARPEGPDSRDRVLEAQGISEPSTASCLLAVDVGNTVTKFGVFAADELAGTWEVTTSERCTADEAWAQAARAIDMLGAPEPTSAILSCVVPSLAEVWRSALGKLCGTRPYAVGPGLKTGIRMRYDDPSEVGSDRVADAVAARETYGLLWSWWIWGRPRISRSWTSPAPLPEASSPPVSPWVRVRLPPPRRVCP